MSRRALRASCRRALALLVGCVLAVSWVGSARAMCAMAPGHPLGAAMEHGAASGTAMAEMTGASTHALDAAMVGQPRAPHPGDHPPGDEGCPMHGRGDSPCSAPAESQTRHDGQRVQASVHAADDAPPSGSPSGGSPSSGAHAGTMPSGCAVAAHCAALTVAALTPTESTDAATRRVARARADGPLLGASELAVEPTAPPPRSV